jgi:hypothetical protein
VPVIMARLKAIDGTPVEALVQPPPRERAAEDEPRGREGRRSREGGRRWALTREQRLT